MKIKIGIKGLLLAVLLFSCNSENDYFKESNLPPVVTVKKHGGTDFIEISDSMKASNGTANYIIKVTDETPEYIVRVYSTNYNTSEFTDINDSLVQYHSNVPGEHQIAINVTDIYGEVATAKINLISFENIHPVAKLKYSINGNEITLDASESYDGDEKFGGGSGVVKYEFSFDGEWLPNPNNRSKITQGFDPHPGIIVRVRVYDQENAWDEVTLTIGSD